MESQAQDPIEFALKKTRQHLKNGGSLQALKIDLQDADLEKLANKVQEHIERGGSLEAFEIDLQDMVVE